MAQRPGFHNIQIQSKLDLYELFEDTFQQSGTNSKAEFLKILIDNYLEPDQSSTPSQKTLDEENKKLKESLKAAGETEERLLSRLSLYETDKMKSILEKHKGEKLRFNNYEGQRVTIEISDLPDVFTAIINSVKIQ